MNRIVNSDLFRYYGKTDFVTKIKCLLLIPGFRFTYLFRKLSTCAKYSPMRPIYLILYRRYYFKYGFQISVKTKIGEGFYIGHFGAIVVNSNAVIGNNCNIAHGVTIGQANRGKYKGYPTLGNKVWIGTGAVIVGNITVGDNVLIAPNSYVNFDVPSNSIVIGNPGVIKEKEDATKGYINNILD